MPACLRLQDMLRARDEAISRLEDGDAGDQSGDFGVLGVDTTQDPVLQAIASDIENNGPVGRAVLKLLARHRLQG